MKWRRHCKKLNCCPLWQSVRSYPVAISSRLDRYIQESGFTVLGAHCSPQWDFRMGAVDSDPIRTHPYLLIQHYIDASSSSVQCAVLAKNNMPVYATHKTKQTWKCMCSGKWVYWSWLCCVADRYRRSEVGCAVLWAWSYRVTSCGAWTEEDGTSGDPILN